MTRYIGRYEILAELGAGGMGTVYRALDREIEREVALKWLPGHFSGNEAFIERFKREARVIGRLEHPHIVPIYDVGDHEGRPYIVMRLLGGGTLRERIQRHEFDIEALITVMEQMAGALEVAHAQHIVHRDLKPSNIIFDERGSAFLSDFGIAKVLDAATQLTGSGVIGTPSYMSPEQFKGTDIGGRSDQYSLAVVAFEALAGRLPFEGGTTAQVMFKHLTEIPPSLHEVARNTPPALSPVLARALAKEPGDRFETVTDFVRAMRQAARSEPTLLSEPLTVARSPKPATPPPSGATRHSPAVTAKLEQKYNHGVEAMNRHDWLTAVGAFDEVLAVDATFRASRKLREQAAAQLTQASPQPDPTALSPGAPPPGTAAPPARPVPQPESRGLPSIVKFAAIGGIGLVGLIVVGVLAYILFRGGDEDAGADLLPTEAVAIGGDETATPTTEPTEEVSEETVEPTPEPLLLAINAVGLGASYRPSGEATFSTLSIGDQVTVEDGMALRSGSEMLAFSLPDGTDLYLAPETGIELVEIPEAENENATLLLAEGLMLIDASRAEEVMVESPDGARAAVRGGVGGVGYVQDEEQLSVDCFRGICTLSGAGGAMQLGRDEFSTLNAKSVPTSPEPARSELYCNLAEDLVDCPTPTPTMTITPTATSTPTPTATPTRIFIPPTNTLPPPTPAPTQAPTPAPQPTQPPPQPTRPPPQPTKPPPQPTAVGP